MFRQLSVESNDLTFGSVHKRLTMGSDASSGQSGGLYYIGLEEFYVGICDRLVAFVWITFGCCSLFFQHLLDVGLRLQTIGIRFQFGFQCRFLTFGF